MNSNLSSAHVRLRRAGVQWSVTTFLTLRAARHCRPGCRAQTGSEECLPSGPVAFYDHREYLARFPVAIVQHGGRIVAFGNLWTAPRSVMEALLVHVMAWGKAQGYEWFALGFTPFLADVAVLVAEGYRRIFRK